MCGHTGAGRAPTGGMEGSDTPWTLAGDWGQVFLPGPAEGMARAALWPGLARAEGKRVGVW